MESGSGSTHTSAVRRRVFLFVIVGALAAGFAAGLLSAAPLHIGQRPSTKRSSTAGPNKEAAAAKRDAAIMGGLVQSMMLADGTFSEEPRGDLGEEGHEWLVYAAVRSVSASPAAVTIDVEQYYSGDAAHVEAAKDGVDDSALTWYERNRFIHEQTLPVAPGAGAFLQNMGIADGDYGPAWSERGAVMTFAEFARLYAENETVRQEGYWITVGPNGVDGIAQPFAP